MRHFTDHEAAAFLSECFGIPPAECPDNGKSLAFAKLHLDRGSFDVELKHFAVENNIPLDLEAFTYASGGEVLTVNIPYELEAA